MGQDGTARRRKQTWGQIEGCARSLPPGRRLSGSLTVSIFFFFLSIDIELTHNIVLVSGMLHKDLAFVYIVYTVYVVCATYVVSPQCIHCQSRHCVYHELSQYTLYHRRHCIL